MITNKAEQKLQRRQWTGFACVLGAYAKKGGGERYAVTVTERVTCHSNGGERYSETVTGFQRAEPLDYNITGVMA